MKKMLREMPLEKVDVLNQRLSYFYYHSTVLTGHTCQAIAVQEPGVEQRAHHGREAAHLVQVNHIVLVQKWRGKGTGKRAIKYSENK